MTWSINWDAQTNCGGNYTFADNYTQLFGTTTPLFYASASEQGLLLFPNPARETVQLVFKKEIPQRGTFQLCTAEGKCVYEMRMDGRQEYRISVAGLTPGVYFWTLTETGHCGKLVFE